MTSSTTALAAAAGPSGQYVQWGVISISVTNLAIIGGMLVLFVLAVLLPFPRGPHDRSGDGEQR